MAIGNSKARAIYEANIPDHFRRPQTDSCVPCTSTITLLVLLLTYCVCSLVASCIFFAHSTHITRSSHERTLGRLPVWIKFLFFAPYIYSARSPSLQGVRAIHSE